MTSRRPATPERVRTLLRAKLRSPGSLDLYLRILDEIGTPTRDRVQRWWDRVNSDGFRPATIRTYAAVAKSILAALSEDGDAQAAQALRWFRRGVTLPMLNTSVLGRELISDSERGRIYDALNDRARLALDVLRFTGLRVSTLLALSAQNIVQRRGGYWLVTHTKRGRLVELSIPAELATRLLTIPAPWFSWSRQRFHMLVRRTAMRSIGRPVSIHDFRRRYITRVYDLTHDLVLTSRQAGHASTSTTLRYILPDEERAKKLLEVL